MTHSDPTTTSIRVAVVGASGYAGAELLAILSNHANADIVALFGSSKKADEGAPAAADLHPKVQTATFPDPTWHGPADPDDPRGQGG